MACLCVYSTSQVWWMGLAISLQGGTQLVHDDGVAGGMGVRGPLWYTPANAPGRVFALYVPRAYHGPIHMFARYTPFGLVRAGGGNTHPKTQRPVVVGGA
jgi:hypothetical protein